MKPKISTNAVVNDKNHKSLLPERQWTQKELEEMDEREFESEWADIHLPND